MPALPTSLRRRLGWLSLIVVWLVAVGSGIAHVTDYAAKPGPQPLTGDRWPSGTKLRPPTEVPALLVFAHPHCPCTRATLSELARIMAHGQQRVAAYVLFTAPAGTDSTWTQTDLWHAAQRIPGVKLIEDRDGAEARRFGVKTSGHTLLYDTSSRLLFSGGITSARGHEGDSLGRSAILSLIEEHTSEVAATPVYGCALFSDDSPQDRCPCQP